MGDRAAVRPPAVAGQFYPAHPDTLRRDVERMLAGADGRDAVVRGMVVPHAGIMYSGECAGRVWGAVAIPPTVVICAPNHTGLAAAPGGVSVWSRGALRTPLGDVPVAEEFAALLIDRCTLASHDPLAHAREHAIEVQLPFLQLRRPDAEVVPVVLAWDRWEAARELAGALAAVIIEWPHPVLLVASSDMTHYESAESAARKDRLALEKVERLDGEGLLDVCHREAVTMCGRAPVAVTVAAARALGATAATLVDYRHSGWVTGDDRSVVAYAGVLIP